MDLKLRKRLVQILGMMGSDHDGEALAAARMASKLLKQSDLSWDDVLRQVQEIGIKERAQGQPFPDPFSRPMTATEKRQQDRGEAMHEYMRERAAQHANAFDQAAFFNMMNAAQRYHPFQAFFDDPTIDETRRKKAQWFKNRGK